MSGAGAVGPPVWSDVALAAAVVAAVGKERAVGVGADVDAVGYGTAVADTGIDRLLTSSPVNR